MIFQLLRKHPTTRRSILRSTHSKILVWGLSCLVAFSVSTPCSFADDGSELLNSLKSRSPLNRWRKRVEKQETDHRDNKQSQVSKNGDKENKTFSNGYPLILKPSILKDHRSRITRVSQLQDDLPKSDEDYSESEIIKKPSELKKITDIQPYFDYFPGRKEGEDPCKFLCPRPDGAPCDGVKGENFECPKEIKLSEVSYEGRHFGPAVFHWEASNLRHNPLYFEDPALERYGHSWPCVVQPFVSVGKFGLQLAGLPYQMTLDPIHKDIYTLGWYRPGECAPKKIYQIPLNAKAAAVQAGVVTGLIFAIP